MQSNNKLEIEGRIALALNSLKKGNYESIQGAAALYKVNYVTLTRRYYRVKSRRETIPNSRKLTLIEELVLL